MDKILSEKKIMHINADKIKIGVRVNRKNFIPFAVVTAGLFMFLYCCADICLAQEGFNTIKTAYITLEVEPSLDIESLNRRLDTRFIYLTTNAIKPSGEAAQDALSYKVDLIFRKVEELLDMYMYPEEVKLKIVIYSNKQGLDSKYSQLYGAQNTFEAFYAKGDKTIYVNAANIVTTILAHEMAHYIIDEYFVVNPPDKVQELLAGYVDEHLRN